MDKELYTLEKEYYQTAISSSRDNERTNKASTRISKIALALSAFSVYVTLSGNHPIDWLFENHVLRRNSFDNTIYFHFLVINYVVIKKGIIIAALLLLAFIFYPHIYYGFFKRKDFDHYSHLAIGNLFIAITIEYVLIVLWFFIHPLTAPNFIIAMLVLVCSGYWVYRFFGRVAIVVIRDRLTEWKNQNK